jgi:broad specificity phosphatase PhoE
VTVRLYMLRHGAVTSHRGDVPITVDAEGSAFAVGQGFGQRETGPVLVLTGETRRAVDTGSHLAKGITETGGVVIGPRVAFALRNPDLYLAGTRVNMVSSAEALAEQVEDMSAEEVLSHDFFPEFFASPDRIGWWLTHESPPGEDAAAIAARVRAFAASLTDPIPGDPGVVVAVTHSPLLRATGLDLVGRDIGEPPWISGLLIEVSGDGTLEAEIFVGEPS